MPHAKVIVDEPDLLRRHTFNALSEQAFGLLKVLHVTLESIRRCKGEFKVVLVSLPDDLTMLILQLFGVVNCLVDIIFHVELK